MPHLQKLNDKHLRMATELAKGERNLKDICEEWGWNPGSWYIVSQSPLFKQRIDDIRNDILTGVVDETIANRVSEIFESGVENAAHRLVNEVDNMNMESGASARSRSDAARSVLDYYGVRREKQDTGGDTVIILSESKMKIVETELEEVGSQPDHIYESNLLEGGASSEEKTQENS